MKKSLGSLLVALAPVLGLASEAGAACKVTGVNVTDGMLTVTGEGLERRGRIPQVFVDGIEIFPVFSLLTTIEAPLPELNLVGTTVKLLSIKRTPRDRGCDDLFINLHAPDLLFTSPDGIAELTAATTRADEADAAAATRANEADAAAVSAQTALATAQADLLNQKLTAEGDVPISVEIRGAGVAG